MYRIDPSRTDLAKEFKANPIGHHSPDLQRLLNLFRGGPPKGKFILVCTKPHEEWVLGQLAGVRGEPVKMIRDKVFTRIEDAEWEVFRLRWKEHTGQDLEIG